MLELGAVVLELALMGMYVAELVRLVWMVCGLDVDVDGMRCVM